jgi:DNA-binding NarL/FixJ family response regulator
MLLASQILLSRTAHPAFKQSSVCPHRLKLVSFFSPAGPRRKLAEVAVAGERLLVGAYPLIDERLIEDLTETERNVAAQIIAGSTNADIARRREASEHTVANQVQAIFRKLQVRSRSELAAHLQAESAVTSHGRLLQ